MSQATITIQTPDGQVVAEEESDDDGKAALFIPDSHKGQTLTVVVRKGSRTARRVVKINRDSVTVVVQLTAVGIVRDGVGYAVSITGLYKWAQFDGSHTYPSSSMAGGGALNSNGPGFGVDLQAQPPSDFLGGLPLSFVLGFGLPTNIDENGARALYHAYFGDSFLNLEENWFMRLMLAYQLTAIQQCQLALLGGVQFTDVDLRFTTDETSGGGIVNHFTESEFMVDPVLGLGLTCPLNNTNMCLVANWYLTWMGNVSGSGTSTTSRAYNFSANGRLQNELQFGVRIPLN